MNIRENYKKADKQISLFGTFNSVVVMPLKFMAGLAQLTSPASMLLDSSISGGTILDRLSDEMDNDHSRTKLKLSKQGIRGRQIVLTAERGGRYQLTKEVRSATLTFDTRAERNHMFGEIQKLHKSDGRILSPFHHDIVAMVFDGDVKTGLSMNPFVQQFETGQSNASNERKTGGNILSTIFGNKADREFNRFQRKLEQSKRQHDRYMQKLMR